MQPPWGQRQQPRALALCCGPGAHLAAAAPLQCFYDPANDASLDNDDVIFPLAWVDAYQRNCPAGATCQPFEQLQASDGCLAHAEMGGQGRGCRSILLSA